MGLYTGDKHGVSVCRETTETSSAKQNISLQTNLAHMMPGAARNSMMTLGTVRATYVWPEPF